MKNHPPKVSFLQGAVLFSAIACMDVTSAATVITANTPGSNGQPGTNVAIPNTFGDNISLAAPGNGVFVTSAGVTGVVGTPDIDLTWSRSGTAGGQNRWESHQWGGSGLANTGGGVIQIDGSVVGSTYSVTFTPTATTAVRVNGFNFIGDTNGDVYEYRVDLVNLTTNLTVATVSPATWTTNHALPSSGGPSISLNYDGELGIAYRLDMVRIAGAGSGSNIAIDNLSFDQIPEPSAAFLGALGALSLLRRRRN